MALIALIALIAADDIPNSLLSSECPSPCCARVCMRDVSVFIFWVPCASLHPIDTYTINTILSDIYIFSYIYIYIYTCGLCLVFVFVSVFILSLELFRCSSDVFLSSRPRILLGMVCLRPDRLM